MLTVEFDSGRADQARETFAAAGLAGTVEQVVGDAAQVIAEQPRDSWQFVFLDAERSFYVSYWPDLDRILAPGGLLVVDNCISHADEVADFRAAVDADPRFRSTLVPTGAGLLFISKDR